MSYIENRQKSYTDLKRDEISLENATEKLLWSIGQCKTDAELIATKQKLKKNLTDIASIRTKILSLLS